MAKASRNLIPPTEPVVEVVLTLTDQEAKDLAVVLGEMVKQQAHFTYAVYDALSDEGYDSYEIMQNAGDRYKKLLEESN